MNTIFQNIPKDSLVLLTKKFPPFAKFENFNISKNNINSVKSVEVVSSRVMGPI